MHRKHWGLIFLQIGLSIGIVVLLNKYLETRPVLQDKILPDVTDVETPVLDVTNDLSFTENLDKAYENLRDHKYQEALAYFKIANQKSPESMEPFLGVAEVFLELDKLEPAKNNLNSAAKLGNFGVEANNILVKFYILNRQLDKAAEIYTSMSSKNNESLFLGALINILQPNTTNAKEKLELIVNSSSNQEYDLFDESNIADTARVVLEDIKIYETFVDTPHSYLLSLVGQSLIDLNELSLSRRLFFESIRQKSDYRDAWLYLGYSYLLSDNLEQAEDSFEKAKQLDPYLSDTYFYLGVAQMGLNKFEDSIRTFEQAAGFGYEPNFLIQEYLGHNYYKLSKFQQAENSYSQVVNSGNASLEVYVRRGWIFIEYLKDIQGAIANANLAIQSYPSRAMAYNLRGWAYLSEENYDLALEDLERALELDPLLEAAYLNIGVLYENQGRMDLAKENFEKARDLAESENNQSIYERAVYELENINNTE